MKKILMKDALSGHVHISKGKNKYFKTKDSASPSGHSLLAQIDMTHAGIVTRNYGFYLPARMKAGAHTFTKDYKKPVLLGHDEVTDTKPVGRVVHAEYIDSSEVYKAKDSYLKQLYSFQDSSKKRSEVLDFVQHVIREYDSKDGYKGLGHIRGTVRITDPETIQGVLDETYLTVSTSMISDSATCSVCGTDWVAEGLCEHHRGHSYDDDVCVVIPGMMAYDHLGLVNTPADQHAHDFTIIGETTADTTVLHMDSDKKDLYKTNDAYDLAAQLFACNDTSIVSLSSDTNTNLIEIKDNIQKMENIMKNTKNKTDLIKKIKDEMTVAVSVYRFGNETTGSKEISVREYVKDLNEEEISTMVSHIVGMMGEAEADDNAVKAVVKKYFDDTFEAVESVQETKPADSTVPESAEVRSADSIQKKFIGEITYGDEAVKFQSAYMKGAPAAATTTKKKKVKKKAKKMSDAFKLEDSTEITAEMVSKEAEEIVKVENYLLDNEEVVGLAELIALEKNEDAIAKNTIHTLGGSKDYSKLVTAFRELLDGATDLETATSEEVYTQMKIVMGEEKSLDQTKMAALKATDFCGAKGFFPVVDEAHASAALAVLGKYKASDSVKGRILTAIYRKADKMKLDLTKNFDSVQEPCNNNASISVETALDAFEKAKTQLVELGLEIPGAEVVTDSAKDLEIQILEAQLDAANEEIDSLSNENQTLKGHLAEELATRTVDMKMLSGNFEINDRVVEIENHKSRGLDSLKDGLKDLETQFKIQDFVKNDGMSKVPTETVENPTLQQKDTKAGVVSSKESEEDRKFKIYDEYYKRAATYGKKEADRWLSKVQRTNGIIPTID